MKKSALVLPPAPSGSLGDEALVTATISSLRKKGFGQIGIVTYKQRDKWKNVGAVQEYVFMGNFLYANDTKAKFKKVMKRYDAFFCLGADVLDGFYKEFNSVQRIRMVSLAAQAGKEARILGFSFNEAPKQKCIDELNRLPSSVKLFARDPVSYRRLKKAVKKPIALVADVAFLLKPKRSDILQETLKWIEKQKKEQRVVVGLNINFKIIPVASGNRDIAEIFVKILKQLYKQNNNLSFLLIPHDFRKYKGEIDDVLMADMILQKLPEQLKPFCTRAKTPYSAAEVKDMCKKLDIVISARMHLAIACLSQGTPVACITYQGKFKGLFEHFNVSRVSIDPSKAFNPETFARFFMPLVSKRHELKKHIKTMLPKLVKLAKKNFI